MAREVEHGRLVNDADRLNRQDVIGVGQVDDGFGENALEGGKDFLDPFAGLFEGREIQIGLNGK